MDFFHNQEIIAETTVHFSPSSVFIFIYTMLKEVVTKFCSEFMQKLKKFNLLYGMIVTPNVFEG